MEPPASEAEGADNLPNTGQLNDSAEEIIRLGAMMTNVQRPEEPVLAIALKEDDEEYREQKVLNG